MLPPDPHQPHDGDLESVGGDLVLMDLPDLQDVSALHGLRIGGELRIERCPGLSAEAIATLRASLQ